MNENFIALLTTLLAILAFAINPDDSSILLMVVSAFLGFLSGKRYEQSRDKKD